MNTGDRNTGAGYPPMIKSEQPVTESGGIRGSKFCFSDKQQAAATDERLLAASPQLLEALIADLTDLTGLHLQYKVYEWTVEGSSWFVHRSVFVDLGWAVARSIDLLADRIVCLGGSPIPNVCSQVFQSQWGADSTILKSPQEMVAASLRTERKVVEVLDEHRKLARASHDWVTNDVLSHLLTKHGYHITDLSSVEVDGLDPNRQWRWLNTGRKEQTA